MSRVIATNEIKEEFDDVLETPLANFPFDFDESSESALELQTEEAHCSTTASNSSSPQLPGENDDQNRTAKSNTPSDDSITEDEDEDIVTDKERDDAKIKVLYLNCTQEDCGDKLNSLDQLRKHLHNKHRLAPLPCFCGCKSRFDSSNQIFFHLQAISASKFSCPSCSKVFSTQRKTSEHWYKYHQTGQFQCNIDHCFKVEDTRARLRGHQRHKHCPESKRHQCQQDGCSSSFVLKSDLKRHQLTHLNTKPFHCKWPKCVHSTNDRSSLNRHIRNRHFKKQQKNGIVVESDPSKYVRVVNSSKK